MRGEKEKSIEGKFLLLLRFFCGHAYLTDLIRHIRRASEP